MTSEPTDRCRAEFEAWCKETGCYGSPATETLLEAWQAAYHSALAGGVRMYAVKYMDGTYRSLFNKQHNAEGLASGLCGATVIPVLVTEISDDQTGGE